MTCIREIIEKISAGPLVCELRSLPAAHPESLPKRYCPWPSEAAAWVFLQRTGIKRSSILFKNMPNKNESIIRTLEPLLKTGPWQV